ncbi:MAG TPA: hypothetical protein VKZ87_08350 [Ferrovibrio sp.]|uniref:hypothetical protein n=1 Tax=Ferrovibrio sp. TaxID=1917215 RepID=UPI002B4B237A|nr:hypothetical protein [Ferrovibrio sp.]HLT77383.1 hypothetical protein [Ferrovibrio sp.]
MFLGRLLGWVLLALALIVLGGDGLRWLESGALDFAALGEVWSRFAPASLNLLQTIVQGFLPSALWDPGLVTILTWPAVAVLGVLGVFLLLVCRRRRPPQRRPRFGALAG